MTQTIRVLHIISGLGQGGAESVLTRLASHSHEKNMVLSFADEGVYGTALKEAGVELHCLGMQPGRLRLPEFIRLIKKIRELRPDVVQTWMYHADFIAGLASRLAGHRHLAWGIRNSGFELKKSSRSAYYLARLSGYLSRLIPQKIIVCGEQAARLHEQWHYDAKRMVVIQNGYDLQRWQYDEQAAKILRESWHIDGSETVFGFVARWNPLKDHQSLLQAFAQLKQQGAKIRLVLVGKGLESSNAALMDVISGLNLRGADANQLKADTDIILLGMRNDVPAIMSALDIHVLSSIAEGFPNVVAEAMACGTPCVVTDVGDAALMVGDLGWVAAPSQPQDLARQMKAALDYLQGLEPSQRQAYAQQVRDFVLAHFSLASMVGRYEQTWRQMLQE